MRHRLPALACVLAMVSASGVAFLEGQGGPPRTREGRPDLEGTWSYATLTPLERPIEFAGKAVSHRRGGGCLRTQNARRPESRSSRRRRTERPRPGRTNRSRSRLQPGVVGVRGQGCRHQTHIADRRSAGRANSFVDAGGTEARRGQTRLVDGERGVRGRRQGPRLRLACGPAAAGALSRLDRDGPADGARARTTTTCRSSRLLTRWRSSTRWSTSTASCRSTAVRRVGQPIRLWMGSSRGRWDGDTLVVDTTNFKPSVFRGASAKLHLVERFRRVSCRHAALRVHGGRSGHVDETVDGADPDDAGAGSRSSSTRATRGTTVC